MFMYMCMLCMHVNHLEQNESTIDYMWALNWFGPCIKDKNCCLTDFNIPEEHKTTTEGSGLIIRRSSAFSRRSDCRSFRFGRLICYSICSECTCRSSITLQASAHGDSSNQVPLSKFFQSSSHPVFRAWQLTRFCFSDFSPRSIDITLPCVCLAVMLSCCLSMILHRSTVPSVLDLCFQQSTIGNTSVWRRYL